MSDTKPVDTSVRDYWAGHIEAWLASRLKRNDYCRAHGLHTSSMNSWVRRLAPHVLTEKENAPVLGGIIRHPDRPGARPCRRSGRCMSRPCCGAASRRRRMPRLTSTPSRDRAKARPRSGDKGSRFFLALPPKKSWGPVVP